MKTTHTPGPWELEAGRNIKTQSGDFYITYGKDKHGNPMFRDFCELDRNARLIAAAPDMVRALQMAESRFMAIDAQQLDTVANNNDVIELIRSAIAKARGE